MAIAFSPPSQEELWGGPWRTARQHIPTDSLVAKADLNRAVDMIWGTRQHSLRGQGTPWGQLQPVVVCCTWPGEAWWTDRWTRSRGNLGPQEDGATFIPSACPSLPGSQWVSLGLPLHLAGPKGLTVLIFSQEGP